MDAPAPLVERHKTQLLRVTAAWTLIGVILYLALPLLAPAVLLLSIGAPLAWRLLQGSGLPPLRQPSPVIVALLLAGAYLSINATWSLSPSTARVSLVMLFLFIAAVHVTLRALEDGDADSQHAMAVGLYAAMAVAGAVICIEAFSGQWLRQQAMALAPALRPDP